MLVALVWLTQYILICDNCLIVPGVCMQYVLAKNSISVKIKFEINSRIIDEDEHLEELDILELVSD